MAHTGIQPVPKATVTKVNGELKEQSNVIEVQGGYPVGQIDLFIEGRLIPHNEYDAQDGATIRLRGVVLDKGTPYTISIQTPFESSDFYNKADSDKRYLIGTPNYFMNGQFIINQRNNVSETGGYIHDRWFLRNTSSSGGKVRAISGADSDFKDSAINYVGLQCTGMTSYTSIRQRIEDVRPFMGKTICVSFDIAPDTDIKVAVKGILSLRGESNYEEPSRYDVSDFIPVYNKDDLGVQRVSVVLNLPYSSRIKEGREGIDSKNSFLEISIYMCSANGNTDVQGTFTEVLNAQPPVDDGTIRFSNMTLNIGDKDAGYQYVPEADELARCQRYFVSYTGLIRGFPDSTSTNYRYIQFFFPTAMRNSPTVTLIEKRVNSGVSIINEGFSGITPFDFMYYMEITSNNSATKLYVYINRFTLDSEL